MIRKLFGLLLFLSLPLACLDDDNPTIFCSDIACTEQFVTLMVTVKTDADTAVPLDAFEVTIVATGEEITREVSNEDMELFRTNGTYPLFGDEYSEAFQNRTVEIQFKGFVEGTAIVDERYVVGADCCHVLLIDGDLEIIVD